MAAKITISPTSAKVGDKITVVGTDFGYRWWVTITLDGTQVARVKGSTKGAFTTIFNVPQGTAVGSRIVKGKSRYRQAETTLSVVATAPPPPVDQPPVISAITKTNTTQTGFTVGWHVSEVAQGWVEYGATTAYGSETTHESHQDFSQIISGLTANTLYHFRVHAIDTVGQHAISPDQTVTTLAIVVPPPPPTGVVKQFPGAGPATPAALTALMVDSNTDIIEWAGGTYSWVAFINVARTRPLLIRPASGAVVRFDGGGRSDPAFRFGWAAQPALASNFTFDPAGTGGRFVFQNYRLGSAGIVMAKWTENVTFNGGEVENCTGTGNQSHVVYILTDDVHRGKNWRSNNWIVVGPTDRTLSGLHIYHDRNYDGVEAKNWKVQRMHRGAYAWADATGVLIEDWDIKDSNGSIDSSGGNAKGVIKNCHAVNSGPLARGSGYWPANGGMLDGGGNTSA